MRTAFNSLFVIAAATSACDLSADPTEGWFEHLGFFWSGGDLVVQVPDSALVGVPFDVSITTGGIECSKPGPTRVTRTGSRVLVVPFDSSRNTRFIETCGQSLKLYSHRATITFDVPGAATIAFRGHERASLDTITIERSLIVR